VFLVIGTLGQLSLTHVSMHGLNGRDQLKLNISSSSTGSKCRGTVATVI